MIEPKKPNIKVPEGFELHYNFVTEHWALRPVQGFSKKHLSSKTFVPKRDVVGSLFKENEMGNNTEVKNKNLHEAKRNKNDEFYTRLEDIVDELKHYKEHFKNKVVYCPCDKLFNIGQSNFAKYFISQFHQLGIKKLICTQYNPNGFGFVKECDFEKSGVKWEYDGEYEDGCNLDESLFDTYFLHGDGSFDSPECRKIMRDCDIVVTNPPFSLFRQFIEQIMDMNKKFLVIGNKNAITYKEMFPLLKENKIWLGYTSPKDFIQPDGDKEKSISGLTRWFTNLDHTKRHEPLNLHKHYSIEYLKYDNYDAIEVSKVCDIPMDYDGIMGVPITFLDNYCPEQFEILGIANSARWIGDIECFTIINGKKIYNRILIQKRKI